MSNYVHYTSRLNKPIKSRLLHIDIELTERCNNRCIHCYINQPEDDMTCKSAEMDTALVKDVLSQAADLGSLSVRFTGGEPLIREDFSEIYLFARRLGLKVQLYTNARLISSELVKIFVGIPPGREIEVSVYGMSAESYDSVAGVRGAFKQFRHGLDLLIKHQVPFVVKQSILSHNQKEKEEFEAFARTVSGKEATTGYVMKFDLRARRDNPSKNKKICSLRATPDELVAELTREPEKYLHATRQFFRNFKPTNGKELFGCGAGRDVCVNAYGYIQMCMLLRHPETVYPVDRAGHLDRAPESRLSPLNYALTEFFPKIRKMEALDRGYIERCGQCFLKSFCDQCPAKSWEEHGVLDRPVEYLCETAHAEAQYIGLIEKGEKSWQLEKKLQKERIDRFLNA
jgi:radical SAM protein with 4Fe4S-binding SPASM domain